MRVLLTQQIVYNVNSMQLLTLQNARAVRLGIFSRISNALFAALPARIAQGAAHSVLNVYLHCSYKMEPARDPVQQDNSQIPPKDAPVIIPEKSAKTTLILTTFDIIFQDCSSKCLDCMGTASNCTSCATSLVLDRKSILINTNEYECKTACNEPIRTFINKQNYCADCDQSVCYRCSNSPRNCTACTQNYFLTSTLDSDGNPGYTCTPSCSSNQYPDSQLGICRSKSTKADKIPKLFIQKYPSSSTSFFFFHSSLPSLFLDCDSSCMRCDGSSRNCTQCFSPFILSKKLDLSLPWECSSACLISNGWYLTKASIPNTQISQDVCNQCSSSCLTCEDIPTKCTSCLPEQTLFNNACVDSCGAGYFRETNKLGSIC